MVQLQADLDRLKAQNPNEGREAVRRQLQPREDLDSISLVGREGEEREGPSEVEQSHGRNRQAEDEGISASNACCPDLTLSHRTARWRLL